MMGVKEKPQGEYIVGYGKPPRHSQFKKGQSGNPAGRPKGRLNLATSLARALNERVVVNEHGQRRTITKFEAALTQLANMAASGEGKAMALLFSQIPDMESRLEAQVYQRKTRQQKMEETAQMVNKILGVTPSDENDQ